MTNPKKRRIRLDWSRLLGFDQAGKAASPTDAPGSKDPRLVRLGSKVGGKPGVKPRIESSAKDS